MLKFLPHLKKALHDVQFSYATTPRKPNLNKTIHFVHNFSIDHTLKTAFVFGCERTGLMNEDIVLCNEVISINTDNTNTSLNLSQAAIILFHEWFNESKKHRSFTDKKIDIAPFKNKAYFLEQFENLLDQINFWRTSSKKNEMWKNIRNTFTKNNYTNQEMKTLTGIIKDIQKHLKRS